jgi:hypothetical protein
MITRPDAGTAAITVTGVDIDGNKVSETIPLPASDSRKLLSAYRYRSLLEPEPEAQVIIDEVAPFTPSDLEYLLEKYRQYHAMRALWTTLPNGNSIGEIRPLSPEEQTQHEKGQQLVERLHQFE